MPFVITDPCIGTKDSACVDVCPVDCIHPRKDEPEFESDDDAVHPSGGVHRLRRLRAGVPGFGDLREPSTRHQPVRRLSSPQTTCYRNGDAAAVAKAEAIVKDHMAAHPELLAIDPKDRQAPTAESRGWIECHRVAAMSDSPGSAGSAGRDRRGPAQTPAAQLRTRVYASGFASPVLFLQDPADRAVQFVVEQGGRIRVVRDGAVLPTDFLDLRGAISSGGERGLLGMAIPRDGSGRVFVNFTNPAGRHRRRAVPPVGEPARRGSGARASTCAGAAATRSSPQPFANHNGGNLVFGPDGYLYVGMGDGGSGDDPGSPRAEPLGAARQDAADRRERAGRASDGLPDPAGQSRSRAAAARPEIWSVGLRNPWRFSFDDPARGGTGALSSVTSASTASRKWTTSRAAGAAGTMAGATAKGRTTTSLHGRPRSCRWSIRFTSTTAASGQSITGGYVYRGRALGAAFVGRYFFADYVQGRVWSLALTIDTAVR